MTITYRLRQGLRALFAFSQEVDDALTSQHLSSAQLALFYSLSKSEQLHSLNVLRDVLAQSPSTPNDLIVAAVLHDVGKSRYALNTLQRTISVLVKKLLPTLDNRLSERERLDMIHAPFVVRRHHPHWGAKMLAQAGGSEGAVWLVEHHADDLAQWQDHPQFALLARLKEADDRN